MSKSRTKKGETGVRYITPKKFMRERYDYDLRDVKRSCGHVDALVQVRNVIISYEPSRGGFPGSQKLRSTKMKNDLSNSVNISYAHKDSPNGPRYIQPRNSKLPAWAVDVQPVDDRDVREKISSGVYTPSMEYSATIRKEWKEESRRLERQVFKADALAEVGLTDHPKADKAFDLAWDRGHCSGLRTVLFELEQLAELLED